MPSRPRLIGIAGPSCSGKTTLARHLAAVLPGDSTVLSLDSYYRDLTGSPPAERRRFNFDAPWALDVELLVRHLQTLARGEAVERPVYQFATHTRSAHSERVEPGDHVIVEGLFALYWHRLRRLYCVGVFVRASDRLCLERRLARDVAERRRTRASVLTQYATQVRPMGARYVLPALTHADLTVDGAAPVAESAAAILAFLAAGADC